MGIDSQRIASRDRERTSVLKVQRVFRRIRNRTIEMDAAARCIQAFARRYVLSSSSSRASKSSARRASRPRSRRGSQQQQQHEVGDDDDDEEKPAFGEMTRTTATTAPLTVSSLEPSSRSQGRTMLERFDDDAAEEDDLATDTRRRSNDAVTRRSQQREVLERFEVLLWHGVHLGLDLAACPFTGYPVVRDTVGANDALPGMWNVQVGDDLMAINDESAHGSTMPFEEVLQILESGVRPALLEFRRPRLQVKLARAQAAQRRRSSPSPSRYRTSSSRRSSPPPTSSPLLGPIIETPRGRRADTSPSRSMTSPMRRDPIRHRQRTEASLCYLIWREEDGDKLGLKFVQQKKQPYPVVSEVKNYGVVIKKRISLAVGVGDVLLSINQVDVSSMGFLRVLQVLKCSPRPLVLTFRRSRRTYEL
ncbi:hypothetical protein PINS_up010113 [Pythium insidiosum]|nr:hypothetical protein PINS_up010113 [Pythium insidiosum]